MAGNGTFTAFNKDRVGVYTRFYAKKATDFISRDTTGIVAIGLTMDYGADGEIIELTGEELESGACLSKIGYTLADEEILPYRLALTGAYKALLYKLNTNGVKANATVGDIKITAKYTGILGNQIKVVITANTPTTGKYQVEVYFKDARRETFYVSNATELIAKASNYVVFSSEEATPTITATTGTTLTGGTNGTVGTDSYDNFFTALKYKMFDYVAINSADTSVSDKVVEFVNKQITNKGKYVCGVVYNKPLLNNKYIISVDQGLECKDFTITTALMPIFIASLRAGCPLGACLDNNNMTELVGAKSIINPVDDDGDDAFVAALKAGRFLFAYWNDGTVVVEEDINTYTEYDENDPVNYPADYRRNRLIATMNYIGNESQIRINKNIIDGRHSDDDAGNTRYLVKSIVDDVCSPLATNNVISSYDPQTDIVVGSKGSSDGLFHTTNLKYIDSLRQVYQTYNIVLL